MSLWKTKQKQDVTFFTFTCAPFSLHIGMVFIHFSLVLNCSCTQIKQSYDVAPTTLLPAVEFEGMEVGVKNVKTPLSNRHAGGFN